MSKKTIHLQNTEHAHFFSSKSGCVGITNYRHRTMSGTDMGITTDTK